MTDGRWSFDDTHIGWQRMSDSRLRTRVIRRDTRTSKDEWLRLAGEICTRMNQALMQPVQDIVERTGNLE